MQQNDYVKLLETTLNKIVKMVENGDIVSSCPNTSYEKEHKTLENFYETIEFAKGLLTSGTNE